MSYRNVTYHPREELIRLFTWDENGNRIVVDHTYHPYLYVEATPNQKTDGVSIYKTPVRKISFQNQYERYKYIKDNELRRVFENLPCQQQFLVDRFWQVNETKEFAQHPIKMILLDIETYSPNGFPNQQEAKDTINVITIYDSLSREFITWGLNPYTSKSQKHKYISCKTEKELLLGFIKYMESDYPDILSGWNSEFFDIPYIINRCNRVLGEDDTKRLSPVGNVYNRTIRGEFGKEQIRWYIDGISLLDYLDIYSRFAPERESYKLDYIGEIELEERKVSVPGMDLVALADKNWEKFIDYNIQDVNILVKLEDKLQYLDLIRMLAYVGLTTFEAAMGSLSIINGAIAVKGRYRNEIIPTFIRNDPDKTNPGAYVGEPKPGFQKYVFSFDANSLYPNVMISLNLSPETKIGKLESIENGEVTLRLVNGKVKVIKKDLFDKFVKDQEISITKANILFTQKQKGLIPEIVDYYYHKRAEIKKEYVNCKKALAKLNKSDPNYKSMQAEEQRLGTKQLTVKILINSIYGYFGNKQAPIGDDDIAASITLTGQAVIKQSNVIITKYISDKTGIPIDELNADTPVIYNDTDSSYISIRHLIKKLNIPFVDSSGKVSKEVYDIEKELTNYLNQEIMVWGKSELLSKDCRFVFKRESIGDVGVFLQKKRYILHVLDDEGAQCSKTKYVGVEIARTSLPTTLKPLLKHIIEVMLSTQNYQETNKILSEVYDQFKKLEIEKIAKVMGLKNYEKYASECKELVPAKKMPIHCKAAYYYNYFLQKEGLNKRYEPLSSGDKVRFFYVQKPNTYGIDVIGFKYEWPKEFDKYFKIDYDKAFEKMVFAPIERIYQTVGWTARIPSKAVQTDLFALLS